MRRYNIWRPIMLIAVAVLTNSLVTNLCMVLGMERDAASNIGFVAMIAAAFIMFSRFQKKRK
ncbi:hypothetical protein ACX93W_13975 [Paenibacillus sp. CAU 1782]